jgi:hypothetical protein
MLGAAPDCETTPFGKTPLGYWTAQESNTPTCLTAESFRVLTLTPILN